MDSNRQADLKICLLSVILAGLTSPIVLMGGIQFSNRSSVMEILPSGRLNLVETDSIKGWSRESIVQSSGNNSSSNWDPSWTGNNDVTYQVAPVPDLPQNQGDITLNTYYYALSTDLFLGPNRHLIIQASPASNYTFIEGNGYTIDLAQGFANLIQIEPGQTVEIGNAVIRNYAENGIYRPTGSNLSFLNSTIELTDNITLTKPLNLSGAVILNGSGYTITMDPGSSVNLETGQLTANNIVFYGVSGQNLACKTADTNLILQNCNLILTDNYRFKTGGLQMISSIISGFYGFNFESTLTFSISRSVMFDTGVTFSYSPASNRRDLIYMDSSSILYLNGCTLESTTTGMILTTGTLLVDNQNQMYNNGAVSLFQGIMFGDGNPAKDLNVQILPGASLTVESGKLIYANVD